MFDALGDRLAGIFEKLTKRGALGEADVTEAMREVRVALLEADVALPVVKDFVEAVRERATGQDVLRSVTPGQMVVKIVHDQLVETLGAEAAEINLRGTPPVAVLMVGLQGSGKTTTSAQLGEQAGVAVLPVVFGERPLAIAKRAMETGRREGHDVVILDSAGRLHIDSELMDEVAAVSAAAKPTETLLVADAMTGQDAVNMAREFHEKVGITGLVLTRVDGDARGGAALSMKAVTGQPIKLMGVGEKLDALEVFNAEGIAGRILGMGDVVGLVEKASEVVEAEEAEKLAAKMMKGQFSLDDMAAQFRQLRKMGDVKGMLSMVPGIGKVKKQLAEADIDDRMIARQEAIILSMTAAERRKPKLLNGSRRRRIAAGSGTSVQDVNRVLKQFQQMTAMMKKMGKMGKKGLMAGGGLPPGFPPPHLPGR